MPDRKSLSVHEQDDGMWGTVLVLRGRWERLRADTRVPLTDRQEAFLAFQKTIDSYRRWTFENRGLLGPIA